MRRSAIPLFDRVGFAAYSATLFGSVAAAWWCGMMAIAASRWEHLIPFWTLGWLDPAMTVVILMLVAAWMSPAKRRVMGIASSFFGGMLGVGACWAAMSIVDRLPVESAYRTLFFVDMAIGALAVVAGLMWTVTANRRRPSRVALQLAPIVFSCGVILASVSHVGEPDVVWLNPDAAMVMESVLLAAIPIALGVGAGLAAVRPLPATGVPPVDTGLCPTKVSTVTNQGA